MNDIDITILKRLAHEAYPEVAAEAATIKVRVYEVSARDAANGRAFWRAAVTLGSLTVSNPGATAEEARESLAAELVRVKRARCDDGPHRLTRAARERMEGEGIDPRAVVDAAGRAHDREGVREWVVAVPADEVMRFDAELPKVPTSIETITLVPRAWNGGDGRGGWIEWAVWE